MSEPDDYEALWEFAKFCALEAYVLRSLLENLRKSDDSAEEKLHKIMEWRSYVATALGNPLIAQAHSEAFEKYPDYTTQQKRQALIEALTVAQAHYLGMLD